MEEIPGRYRGETGEIWVRYGAQEQQLGVAVGQLHGRAEEVEAAW